MTKEETKTKAKSMTPKQRIAVGVKVINDKRAPFSQQERMAYLLECGLSQSEYLSALNQASGGILLEAAGVVS